MSNLIHEWQLLNIYNYDKNFSNDYFKESLKYKNNNARKSLHKYLSWIAMINQC